MSLRIQRLAIASLVAALTWQAASAARAYQSVVDETDTITVRGEYIPDQEIRRQAVAFADLDLRRDAGVRTLLHRIHAAARTVCEPQPSIHDLQDQSDYRICFYDAVADAVHRVNNPRVAALWENEG
jgi:UrcA family protein